MAKKIYTVLKLKDEFTKPLKNATKEEKDFARQARVATANVNKLATKAANAFTSAAKKAALFGSALAGIGIKTGFTEALDMQGYRAQLDTAVKDTQKASKIMKKSIQYANSTPFEASETVEAAAKFESMSMDSSKWVALAGDMAGATSKGLDQAVEALIDAQTGELERLKEFGITKNMIVDQAKTMGNSVVNNSGQITDLKKFNDALVELMDSKYTGGAKKQAETIRGTLSTISGVAKNSLAKILGMTDDGLIKSGSALDIVKNKATQLAEKLQQWQNDGTIEKIADKVSNGVTKAFDMGARAVKFFGDNWNWLKPLLIGGVATWGTFSTALKAVSGINSTISTIKTFSSTVSTLSAVFKAGGIITSLGKAASTAASFGKAIWAVTGPAGLVMLALSALVAAVVWMYKNWDKVKPHVQPAIDVFNKVKSAIQGIIDKITALVNKIKNSAVGKLIGSVVGAAKGLGGAVVNKVTGHATGSAYFRGGLTRANEFGGEIMNLPSGTQIIPHDVSMKAAAAGGNINVNVIVQGNVVGNEEYADELGNIIVNKIKAAGDNV